MTAGLQGKVALITGGSRGIGKSIALAMASEGMRLVICARDERQLKLTADEIQMHTKADIIAVKANMTKLNDVHRFVTAAVKKFNRIDVLVNNAGGTHIGGILNTTDEDWEYHIQLKLLGYIRVARDVIPHMKANGGGKIINIIGTAGKAPTALFMVPSVTNGAVLNFTKSLSKDLESEHITVNAVNPGTTDTPLTEETFKSLATIFQKTMDEVRTSVISNSPQGRIISPEDVARVVLFLVSETAGVVNGTSINVDAGKVLGLW